MDINRRPNPEKRQPRIPWGRLALAFVALIVLSFGLNYLLQSMVTGLHIPVKDFGWLAYLVVFGTSLLSNLTIVAPVPIATSIMIAVATEFSPLIIALFASAGGALGEMSGYYAGYLGRKIALTDQLMGYSRIEGWVQRNGAWAIFIIAVQPILPFDFGGMIAGAAKMPLRKFMPALWAGRFVKYLLVIYAGLGVIKFTQFWGI